MWRHCSKWLFVKCFIIQASCQTHIFTLWFIRSMHWPNKYQSLISSDPNMKVIIYCKSWGKDVSFHRLWTKKCEHPDPRGQRHTWPEFWLRPQRRPGQQNFSRLHWQTDRWRHWLFWWKQTGRGLLWHHQWGRWAFTRTVILRLFRRPQSPGSRANAILLLWGLKVFTFTWETHTGHPFRSHILKAFHGSSWKKERFVIMLSCTSSQRR